MNIRTQISIFKEIRMHQKIYLKVLKNRRNKANFHDGKNFCVKNHKLLKYYLILKLF